MTIEGPRVTVGFERSVRVREYENATASIYVQVPTAPGDFVAADGSVDKQAIIDAAKPVFFAAKSLIFEQLGLPSEVTPELVVQEILERALGAVEVTSRQGEAIAEATNLANASAIPPANKGPAVNAPSNDAERWAELSVNPSKYFDNREDKRNPKAPDFKRKGTGEGLWLTNKTGASNVPAGVNLP